MTGFSSRAGVASPERSDPGATRGGSAAPAGARTGLPVIGAGGSKPAGLVLGLDEATAADVFRIAIVDGAGRTLLPLGPFREDEVVATWRGLGAASGLELMIARPDGSVERPYPQLGRVRVGAIRIRRRHGLLAGRRPRFLVRRKTGRLPVRPEVYRGEREIAGGLGA